MIDLNQDSQLEILAASGPGKCATLNVIEYSTWALIGALFLSENPDGVPLDSNPAV